MSTYGGLGGNTVKSHARNVSIEGFRFTTTTATTAAASVVDSGGLLATGHTHASAGVYLFPLREKYAAIVPLCANIECTTAATFAKVSAIVDGSAATNSIGVEIHNAAGATDTPGSAEVTVTFLVVRS